jgi:undecaprenyl-diphosphatase
MQPYNNCQDWPVASGHPRFQENDMDPLQALVLGIVQGLTEFLPISSSGHLALIPWLFGWKDPGLTFDVALHMGTLIAVIGYFWRDWVDMFGGFARTVRRRSMADDAQGRLFWLLVVASIPGAIVGALAESAAANALRAPAVVASLMIGVAFLLIAAEAAGSRKRLLKDIGLSDAVIVGISQAIAICPGVSRSGITMTTGLFAGLSRETAARFSFLMSTPIIAGAGLFSLRHVLKEGLPSDERMAFFLGFLAAAAVGYLAISVLLRYIQHHSLRVFAYYRFAFGALVLAIVLIGVRG